MHIPLQPASSIGRWRRLLKQPLDESSRLLTLGWSDGREATVEGGA